MSNSEFNGNVPLIDTMGCSRSEYEKLEQQLAEKKAAYARAAFSGEAEDHAATRDLLRQSMEQATSLQRQNAAMREVLEHIVACFRLDKQDGYRVLGFEVDLEELARIQAALEAE